MLKSEAAWSLFSNTNAVERCSGTARAPVAGSGVAPACTASVSKPGSDGPGMVIDVLWRGGCFAPEHCGRILVSHPSRGGAMKVSDILRVKGGTLFTVS